jgi:putative ABC transport system permease protein
MLRHALTLVWNRRRANRLLVVEIAAAFVITFVLTALGADLWSNYRRPLGFDYRNVWDVAVVNAAVGGMFGLAPQQSHSGTLADVVAALSALPRTETVAPIMMAPYGVGEWRGEFRGEGDRPMSVRLNRTTAEALRAIDVRLVEGRLFGPEDEGQDYRAVLVNRAFVEEAFGPDAQAIGRRIDRPDPDFPIENLPEEQRRSLLREIRIVGVIEDFRQHGELSDTVPYVINRHEEQDERGASFSLMLRVAPGTDASFEEQIVSTIESVAPGWVASVTPWERLRERRITSTLLPLKAAATIAAFFIALVVMGLIGVLWQDVVRRTQEIGLRRALGAVAGSVRRQIQVEMLIVGVFGILIGTAIAIQFPLLELVERIDWRSAAVAIAVSAALILLLVALGALYPSWLASRREPADALRYE